MYVKHRDFFPFLKKWTPKGSFVLREVSVKGDFTVIQSYGI